MNKKRYFSMVSQALQQRKERVALNVGWSWIHETYAVGTPSGKMLLLTAEDRECLRRVTTAATEIDPLTIPDLSSRTAAAGSGIDEKWSRGAVAEHHVYLGRHGAALVTRQGECVIPDKSGLWVDYRNVQLAPDDVIVIVENLEAFLHWSDFTLPSEIVRAVVLYRGHASDARAARAWLESVAGTRRIVAFTDFDPAGLQIAKSTPGVTDWMIPSRSHELLSKRRSFSTQSGLLEPLLKSCPPGWQEALSRMVAESLAVTQESMCARKVPLVLCPAS